MTAVVEVLVATMGQQDLQLSEKMNVQGNCLIANQNGIWGYQEQESQFGAVRMICSATKGVGVNRNIALGNAKGDILLFADDDVRYYDGALAAVEKAFLELTDADVIAFGMDMTRNGTISARRIEPCKRRHIWNAMRFGACRIAIRRSAVEKYSLSFSPLFGGGCQYSCGEDTLFLRECFRKKLKVYSHSYVLGTCQRDRSSWFAGYTDKFFYDYGALLMCAFPKGKHWIKWYFAAKLHKKSGVAAKRILSLMNEGIKAFPTLTPYVANRKFTKG